MRRSWRNRSVVAALIGSIAAGAAVADDALPTGEPLAVASTLGVPLDPSTMVSVVGLHGVLSISTGETREIRVNSRVPGTAGGDLAVGIWRDGERLIVAPAPGAPQRPGRIDIAIPEGVRLAVDAVNSEVVIRTRGGAVDLHGSDLRATVQADGGFLVAELMAGTLAVSELKDITARLRGTVATISNVSGNVTARSSGGSLKVTAVGGSTDVEGDQTKLTFEKLLGSLNVKAQRGEATVTGCAAGAELALVGTSLRMTNGLGDIAVTSDAPVVFQKMEGSMLFDMSGASLRGTGHVGDLEFRGRNTQVSLESITGVLHLQGDGLTASVVGVGGEFQVEATSSSVAVQRAGDIVLTVDSGSVSIKEAAGSVKANVTGADVQILGGMGPVTLEMDGGDGEVSWATISGVADSALNNAGGKLTVRFAKSGGCRVEAKSTYGRIDNELEKVRVADDLTKARGSVNGGEHPYVRITASGDIRLENERTPP